MRLAVISMVINLLVLAGVPGHISILRYGKEMKRKQRTPSLRQDMVREGSWGAVGAGGRLGLYSNGGN